MSFFDTLLATELLEKSIPYKILSREDSSHYEAYINKNFKFKGPFIDWSTVDLHSNLKLEDINQSTLQPYLNPRENKIFIIGDSLTDESYVIEPCSLERAIEIFYEIPQHSYFLPSDASWILCISSDGEIDIGLNRTTVQSHSLE